ncbi:hypothetical protein Dalu01_02272 [Deinococcus aluminii]|uniref:Uncharacterized protein n=2 Tax=Deinococcus aluminii TaxID=1656885 RepID=A0ABP9XES7_9DEIO
MIGTMRLDETSYPDALTRIQALWDQRAGEATHPDHAEFHALYLAITAYEEDAGLAEAPKPAFQITTPDHLAWYVGKKADLQSKAVRIKAQAAAMLRELEREEERLDARFAEQAEQVLRAQLSGRKKSVKFLTGTVGLRKVPGRVQVADEAALENAILTQAPFLDSVIVKKIDARLLNSLVKVEGDAAFLAEDGTVLALPGLQVTPGGEKFYVKAGNEEETA